MGQKASTGAHSGFLDGASVPPPPGVILPAPPQRPVKVTIPQPNNREQRPLKPGDTFSVKLSDERMCMVRVPQGATPGQQVQMLLPEYHKMVASTLHAPPVGFKVLAQKPIVVANISYQIQGLTKEQASSQEVASLMQAAQNELLRQAHAAGCNAVLGIGFSVTTTSSTLPGQGACTLAMVSAFGTPCTIGKDGVTGLVATPGVPVMSSAPAGPEAAGLSPAAAGPAASTNGDKAASGVSGDSPTKDVVDASASMYPAKDDDEFAEAESVHGAEATDMADCEVDAEGSA